MHDHTQKSSRKEEKNRLSIESTALTSYMRWQALVATSIYHKTK